jgi:dCMP deaminase
MQVADWDSRFIQLAMHIATWSKDRSTKVGCVIVGPLNEIRAVGYNGFPRWVDDSVEERHTRPAKYLWTEHAERNAIFNAARVGISLIECRMYLPWFPCMDCARAIVQCGIVELIAFQPDLLDSTWGDHFKSALEMMREARVNVRFVAKDCASS